MHRQEVSAVGAALGCALLAAAAQADCKISQLAEWHTMRAGNEPLIQGQVNDQPVRVLLDTGSYASFIGGGTAHRLHLRLRDDGGMMSGVNGTVAVQTALVDHLKIGNFTADDLLLRVAGNRLGRSNDDFGVVLGSDFFRHFDTEFDLGHDVVRLLKSQDCKPEQLVYWDRGYFQLSLERLGMDNAALITHVKINGTSLRAQLDTGASLSVITTRAAHEAGVNVTDPGVQPAEAVHGVADSALPTWIGRFDSVTIGQETAANARLLIGDLFGANRSEATTGSHIATHIGDPIDLLLGADFFQAHRMVVLPEANTAVFTYNGGPVFQVERPNTPPPAQ